MPEGKPPKAFISYKWEGPETSEWVEKFARDLRRNGVDAFLDVWEVEFGGSFIKYMTRNIPDADVFFFVMTPNSIRAVEAEEGEGGAVAFEVEIATVRKIEGGTFQFIPILLRGEKPASFLRSYRYADFRDPARYEGIFKDLVRSVTGESRRPLLLGAGTLEYAYRLYEMWPAERGNPFRTLAAQFETFVGFPFYSHESDHPSSWPPRVEEDRDQLRERIFAFLGDAANSARVAKLLAGSKTRISSKTTGTQTAEEERISKIYQTYMNLRAFTVELGRDAPRLRKALGGKASKEFLELEKARAALGSKMPNRFFKLALRQSQGLELKDVAIDIQIIGTVYDVTVNNVRPIDRDSIEGMTIQRTMLHTGPLPGNTTTLIRIWYHFVPVSARWDPKPIHVKADPTQGMLLYGMAAEGIAATYSPNLIPVEDVYNEYKIELPAFS